MSRRGVILDRDGTLIDVVRDEESGVISTAFHPDQLVLLGAVLEGLRVLRDAGFVLAIATNQPGPAKGQFSAAAVKRTNDALVEKLASASRLLGPRHPDIAALQQSLTEVRGLIAREIQRLRQAVRNIRAFLHAGSNEAEPELNAAAQ